MERENYEKLYAKQPKEIIDYIQSDMLTVMGYAEIDDNNMLDKITEWRYILLRIIDKLK